MKISDRKKQMIGKVKNARQSKAKPYQRVGTILVFDEGEFIERIKKPIYRETIDCKDFNIGFIVDYIYYKRKKYIIKKFATIDLQGQLSDEERMIQIMGLEK